MSVRFEDAQAALEQRLSGNALAHSLRVAETADSLALIYGVDRGKARLAGLLHDWDRSSSADELIAAASRYGIHVGEAERGVPYLLHALTGAAAVRASMPDLDPDVVNAIERHTVGAPDMSDLDMVVYLADMLEPARDFDGVDDLREIVGEVSLGTLFFRAYQHSLMHLLNARKWIHPVTVDVWNRMAVGEGHE